MYSFDALVWEEARNRDCADAWVAKLPVKDGNIFIELRADWEDCLVKGNAMASGDEEYDAQVEQAIIDRLEDGDVWAWASVSVRASFGGLEGEPDYLGCCSYESFQEFVTPDGYLPQMVGEALESLQQAARDASEDAAILLEGFAAQAS